MYTDVQIHALFTYLPTYSRINIANDKFTLEHLIAMIFISRLIMKFSD